MREKSKEKIIAEIEYIEKEVEGKEEEIENLHNRLNYLYSELRQRAQEEKTETIEVSVTYGGKLPVAPERVFE